MINMGSRADIATGNVIADQMHRKRISQTKLSKQLNWHQTTLSKKLRGEVTWSVSDVLAVADALEMSPIDLMQDIWRDLPSMAGGTTNHTLLCGALD
jgi:transcriptional regulator with XRE-family HTH domain